MNLKRQITRKEGRESRVCGHVLFFVYCLFAPRYIRWLIRRITMKLESGEKYSLTLRRMYKKCHGIDIGMYSYGCFTQSWIPAGTTIGRYCSFAKGVVICNANHPLERLSLHPFFYNAKLKVVERETITRGNLSIGHDVWIGRNTFILPGVRQIGNGAVIGAGAIVTHDVPPYAIVGGNPARIIRYRFPQSIRQAVEASKWWTYSIEELKCSLSVFLEPVSSAVVQQFVLARKEAYV